MHMINVLICFWEFFFLRNFNYSYLFNLKTMHLVAEIELKQIETFHVKHGLLFVMQYLRNYYPRSLIFTQMLIVSSTLRWYFPLCSFPLDNSDFVLVSRQKLSLLTSRVFFFRVEQKIVESMWNSFANALTYDLKVVSSDVGSFFAVWLMYGWHPLLVLAVFCFLDGFFWKVGWGKLNLWGGGGGIKKFMTKVTNFKSYQCPKVILLFFFKILRPKFIVFMLITCFIKIIPFRRKQISWGHCFGLN